MKTTNDNINTYIRKYAKKKYAIDLLGGKCKRCGETRLHLLNFHHIDHATKEFTIASYDIRISDIIRESLKCQVLCNVCHRELHHTLTKKSDVTRSSRYKQLMFDYLKMNSCQKCGYDECISCLDFHHINKKDKKFSLSTIKERSGILPDEVKLELNNCTVLCSNCHLDLHFDNEKFNKYYSKICEKSKNLTEKQSEIPRELVYDMYVNKNMKQIEIARHFKASKGTINDILKSYGLTRKLGDCKLDINKIIELYCEGFTCNEIANKLGNKNTSIYSAIVRLGYKPNLLRERGPLTSLSKNQRNSCDD